MTQLYFPLFVNLSGKKVLVVGGGTVGLRRARILAEFGACVIVVTLSEFHHRTERMENDGRILWKRHAFQEEDVEGMALVEAATDDDDVNNRIAALCRKKQIPVNHAGDRDQCDFYFPGIARDEHLVVGVCASGEDHKRTARTTSRLKEWMKQHQPQPDSM